MNKKATIALIIGLLLAYPTSIGSQSLTESVVTAAPVSLRLVKIQPLSLGSDEQLSDEGSRQDLLQAIEYSLKYLETPTAAQVYQDYPITEITLERVRLSLKRFRELLLTFHSPEDLQRAVEAEFDFYQAIGRDNRGGVLFTGYFEPVYPGSRQRSPEYPYPLYALPADFSQWSQPHPTRLELEGKDGLLGEESPLTGYEIVWLRDRLEAYLVQVQGSARLELTDGSTMTVGYAGRTEYPYVSLGRELVKDGRFQANELSLPIMINYFRNHPAAMHEYIGRNNRLIFFRETYGAPPLGSINVPVTPERSIATDKTLMPPGALALIHTHIPERQSTGQWEHPRVTRYVLDQDTGGAITGPGRVDVFIGSGPEAGERAGRMSEPGTLYYLLLK
ncbi:murein transglycosylase A [Gloeocapsa sp. PCC 73106]|uniref:murein transglycosylase A n=1 Tax=Gloeocapsa sp. PCC 73106 TaxID=102232 RepID=UPI0002ACF1F9|nr:MltA domain-containing protein [Gloeocapsa sp. PCC 73106]ELR98987.1 membrane-bound lytic murein transglycosylase [Gloeocapsa sp. PCC 73106]